MQPLACTALNTYNLRAITGHLCNWLRTLACISNLAAILCLTVLDSLREGFLRLDNLTVKCIEIMRRVGV